MGLSFKLTMTMLVGSWLGGAFSARAQDNYEIQVYGSETVEKGHTMVELHEATPAAPMERFPPTTSCTKLSKSLTGSTTGLKPDSIFLLPSRTGMDGTMWAITFGRACECHPVGIGR